jgi:peptidoglycan/xylan/chitin deacetylase (PgdA/CDA1 family)
VFPLLFQALSPAGTRARLHTLIFHRVLPQRDELFPGEVTAGDFNAICSWLKAWFNVLPLAKAAQQLREGRLPSRALCISFDDGYADNHDVALPILQHHGLSATIFVATGFLDGGRMWNDTVIESVRRTTLSKLDLTGTAAATLGAIPLVSLQDRRDAISCIISATKYLAPPERTQWVQAVAERAGALLPTNMMMRSDQVRTLHRAGMGVGGHTVSHPILAQLGTAVLQREISEGRRQLQDIIRAPVSLFAYPNGRPGTDYDERAVQAVQEQGFSAAMSTTWGTANHRSDLLQLPRFTPWDRSRTYFGLRLARQMFSS